ncbi:hypothetical protein [Streptomyces sp. CA-146814]|uniref:hypothetical protein n=1 Tax=Streptomyces sp. CA-146814 TaxID=3240053 RepID=UPI003D9242DC
MELETVLTHVYKTRLALISPPRTGSTAVARLLWQHPSVTHHCHEPFEACYWGDQGPESVESILANPMVVESGLQVPLADVPHGGGLLIKDMSFQLSDAQFAQLVGLTTAPPVFVICDPRLSTTSRLRIVRQLNGAETFPAFESGWQSLREQLELCRARDIPYVLVDSDDLRTDPAGVTAALLAAVGLPPVDGLENWSPRPGLQLVSPEVGALMSDARKGDDPFYRKVLGSSGIQPRSEVRWEQEEAAIAAAGLADDVTKWRYWYEEMREDPALIAGRPAERKNNADAR